MPNEGLLWSQKANSKSNNYKNFGFFLYDFIGGKLTILAFLGLFGFVGYHLGYFGHFLTLGIGVFLYYIISDAFNVFWTGVNLEYQVTDKYIRFIWGVSKQREIIIPFEEITNISAEYGAMNKRSAIIFENSDKFKNGDFGFSQERYFNQLSFENVNDIEALIRILNDVGDKRVEIIKPDLSKPWEEQLPSSTVYLKVLQLVAFLYLFISSSLFLNFIDFHFLKSEKIVDTVISQEYGGSETWGMTNKLTTKNGYTIELTTNPKYKFNYLNKNVGFSVSPMFNNITTFENFNTKKHESLKTGQGGASVLFKLLSIIAMIISCMYIFYKRGVIPFFELGMVILGPLFFLLPAVFLFT